MYRSAQLCACVCVWCTYTSLLTFAHMTQSTHFRSCFGHDASWSWVDALRHMGHLAKDPHICVTGLHTVHLITPLASKDMQHVPSICAYDNGPDVGQDLANNHYY